ncbi:MAG: hypothetical protein QM811_12785 [Pirellulales bacterium]
MLRSCRALLFAALLAPASLFAQNPFNAPTAPVAPTPAAAPRTSPQYGPSVSKASEVTGTPEMWFYEQERLRYDDPTAMSRMRAEFQANQRQSRIAAMKWYGQSNSRPMAGTDPVHGSYAPRWIGNGWSTQDWSTSIPAPAAAYGGVSIQERIRRY